MQLHNDIEPLSESMDISDKRHKKENGGKDLMLIPKP